MLAAAAVLAGDGDEDEDEDEEEDEEEAEEEAEAEEGAEEGGEEGEGAGPAVNKPPLSLSSLTLATAPASLLVPSGASRPSSTSIHAAWPGPGLGCKRATLTARRREGPSH
jgi:hypothetical protein